MNIPTWITLSRLLGLPFILYLLKFPTTENRWIAAIIFILAASTDWLDGYLARKLDLVTDLGKFLDPLVDKLLVLGTFLALIELQLVPAWGVCIIMGRELAIAGWRVNPSLNKSISGANIWGKLKTVTQIIAIAILIMPLSPNWNLISLGIFWIAVFLTIVSGIIYVLPQRKSVKI